jgi:hypothetical protein
MGVGTALVLRQSRDSLLSMLNNELSNCVMLLDRFPAQYWRRMWLSAM